MNADGFDRSALSGPATDDAVIELLTRQGKLDDSGLQRARRLQSCGGEHLHTLLVKLGVVSEGDVAAALGQVLALPLVTPQEFPHQPMLDGALSPKFLKDSRILPIADGGDAIVLAMADPLDDFAVRAIAIATGKLVERRIATPAEIEKAQERLYGRSGSPLSDIVDTLGEGGDYGGDDAERLKDMASEAPVIRFVN